MNQIDLPVLTPIQLLDLPTLDHPAIFGHFSFHFNSQKTRVNLALSDKYLLYFQNSLNEAPTHLSALEFDLKFQVIRETPWKDKKIPGRPLGIRFQKELSDNEFQIIELLSDDENMINQWRIHLEKKINQRNFHALFKAKRQIGKGAFALVFEAERLLDNKVFAVKGFSKKIQYSGENGKASLINEINIMKQFDHPMVQKLEGVYETTNSIYVILEMMHGEQLQKRLQNKQFTDPAKVKSTISNLLTGLIELAGKRVIHRDLKPANIMFRAEDSCELTICDFGLATFADAEKYLFVRCGTPGFVAPEILNIRSKQMGVKSDPISDVFSAGLIFHYLLLGRSIFDGNKYSQILTENQACSFDFSKEIYKEIDPHALDLLIKMLQKNPTTRLTAYQALQHSYFQMQQQLPRPARHQQVIDQKQQKLTQHTFNKKHRRFSTFDEQNDDNNIQAMGMPRKRRSKENDSSIPQLISKRQSISQTPEILRRSKRNSVLQKRQSFHIR